MGDRESQAVALLREIVAKIDKYHHPCGCEFYDEIAAVLAEVDREAVAWQWGVDIIGAGRPFWGKPFQNRGEFDHDFERAKNAWSDRKVIERALYTAPLASEWNEAIEAAIVEVERYAGHDTTNLMVQRIRALKRAGRAG